VKVFGRGNRYGVEPGNEFGYVNCEVEASGGQEIRDLEGEPAPPGGAKAQRRKGVNPCADPDRSRADHAR